MRRWGFYLEPEWDEQHDGPEPPQPPLTRGVGDGDKRYITARALGFLLILVLLAGVWCVKNAWAGADPSTYVSYAEANHTRIGATREQFVERTGPNLTVLYNSEWSRDYTRPLGWTTARVFYSHDWTVRRVVWVECEPYGGPENPTTCTAEVIVP
jgi:hypothetical protein